MKKDELIQVERRELFALITLNQASMQAAITVEVIEALMGVFTTLRDDPSVRAIILAGDKKCFYISADGEGEMVAKGKAVAHAVRALAEFIENLNKPVIASITGPVDGYGCNLIFACTWRIAASDATFTLPNSLSASLQDYSWAELLSRMIGRSQALEIILKDEALSAEQAKDIGLVNRIVNEQEDLLQVCEDLARKIGRNAPLAIKYVLDAVNRGSDIPLANGLQLESALFGLCFATKDVFEGTNAFLEKRFPVFSGQ